MLLRMSYLSTKRMYNEEQVKYAKESVLRLNKSQIGHYITSENYDKWHGRLGIWSVVISAVTSGLLLFDYQSDPENSLKFYIIVSSIIASVLTSLLAFLGLENKSFLHRSKANQYGSLKRKVETFVAKGDQDFGTFAEALESEWNLIANDSPVTPRKYRSLAKEVLTEDNEDRSNFVEK